MSSENGITNGTINDFKDQWIHIQKKTFTNWINEQLSVSGRCVDDIGADFCDGVRLVALVESLQFRKIGKVHSKPTRNIQKIANVSLAFKAIAEDNIKLVNIGEFWMLFEIYGMTCCSYSPALTVLILLLFCRLKMSVIDFNGIEGMTSSRIYEILPTDHSI